VDLFIAKAVSSVTIADIQNVDNNQEIQFPGMRKLECPNRLARAFFYSLMSAFSNYKYSENLQ
jgi:hypothetical protein